MPEIPDGGVAHVQGSAKDPYELKNLGGVFSCTCPAWRNQSTGLDRRTCKHLKAYRSAAAEKARIEAALAANPDAPDAQRARDAVTATPRAAAVKKETAPPVLLAHRWEKPAVKKKAKG